MLLPVRSPVLAATSAQGFWNGLVWTDLGMFGAVMVVEWDCAPLGRALKGQLGTRAVSTTDHPPNAPNTRAPLLSTMYDPELVDAVPGASPPQIWLPLGNVL